MDIRKKWEENLKLYDELVAKTDRFKRKGKTSPYTSANGHMFSFLNKAGELGFRYGEEAQAAFMETHDTTAYKSNGATLRGYVLIPDAMLEDLDALLPYLEASYDYVMSLKPK